MIFIGLLGKKVDGIVVEGVVATASIPSFCLREDQFLTASSSGRGRMSQRKSG
jgi:hypothetical protein